MKKYLILTLLAVSMTGCQSGDSPAVAEPPGALGFDPGDLDPSIRPQDDFFAYVNAKWIENTDIPPEWSSYGTMTLLYEQTEKQVFELIGRSSAGQHPGDDATKIDDLYSSFMDESRLEALQIEPIAHELDRVGAIVNHDDVIRYMGHALTIGVSIPIDFYIDTAAEDPERNLVYVWQAGLGLPDRDYYLAESEQLQDVRTKYTAHIQRMFQLAQWPDGATAAGQIMDLETRIAEKHWSSVQNRDREKIYRSQYSLETAAELAPELDWKEFLEAAGFGQPELFVIAQTDYFAALGPLIKSVPVETWQTWLQFKVLKAFAPYLQTEIVNEDFDFQRRVLRGQDEIRPRWKRGVRLVNAALGEAIGRLYVEQHFPPESKQRVDAMIDDLGAAFSESINTLDWMSEDTREAAQTKLDRFSSKIGYPDKWRDYSSLEIARDDLVGNVQRYREFEHFRQAGKLGKPVDRSEWGMTPQTVNAYYRPTMNQIVFPAAILQPPFFDATVDDATNYGAIGAIIGHEFSHGFDDQGRKFNGAGELANWWSESDAAEYEARAAVLVDQYNQYLPIPDQAINGELTLGENIADLAGLTIAYRAWQISQAGKTAPVIDGFTGEQRFFIGYAQSWRSQIRDEYLRELLLRDAHSPARYRVIGVLRNMPEFYRAFDVQADDPMFLPASERVQIW
jgi:putative endopeptidase